jgi:hypothetical protein
MPPLGSRGLPLPLPSRSPASSHPARPTTPLPIDPEPLRAGAAPLPQLAPLPLPVLAPLPLLLQLR